MLKINKYTMALNTKEPRNRSGLKTAQSPLWKKSVIPCYITGDLLWVIS